MYTHIYVSPSLYLHHIYIYIVMITCSCMFCQPRDSKLRIWISQGWRRPLPVAPVNTIILIITVITSNRQYYYTNNYDYTNYTNNIITGQVLNIKVSRAETEV